MFSKHSTWNPLADSLLERCVSIDLEVNPKTNKIHALAAVKYNESKHFAHEGPGLGDALFLMDEYCKFAEYVIGHNYILFDAHYLRAASPNLDILNKPVIDTLWLNPLSHPSHPYHHLVKHYKDGELLMPHRSDPVLDAKIVFEVFHNQMHMLSEIYSHDQGKGLIDAYHFLTTYLGEPGFDAVFSKLRTASRPDKSTVETAIHEQLMELSCFNQVKSVLSDSEGGLSTQKGGGWPLAYALAWISVSGGSSVMPPWVRHQFPEAGKMVRRLRDTQCEDESCQWCHEQHSSKALLRKWFELDEFRPKPADSSGISLQKVIVETAMKKTSLLGILPTGTGKSLCYQLPALSQYEKTGALTVVISPLVALMADQVEGMHRRSITSATTINGMLSAVERKDALSQVRLGETSILLIAPEQLRSRTVRTALEQREIGYWVIDEAHCVSKWGHDFRPDYRYIGKFIKKFSDSQNFAPIICLTATAKLDVVQDITEYFKLRLNVVLETFDGGTRRENLSFMVVPTNASNKPSDLVGYLESELPRDGTSGAIVYCSTRNSTEELADYLFEKGFSAAPYHAKLTPEKKKETQAKFSVGNLRVIAATNAFGMGIDKPDIRLVIHADIPGSLENYLQEAGRAGRDRQSARCVLLYDPKDVERQFSLEAYSRVTKQQINAVLESLRRLDKRTRKNGEVVATSGEIVRQFGEDQYQHDTATDDTKVRTAISWLEESMLLEREENRVSVYPSSFNVATFAEASELIEESNFDSINRKRLRRLVLHIMNSPSDQGISTDELCNVAGCTPAQVRKALYDLESLGISRNDTVVTVFVHMRIEDSSKNRLDTFCSMENDLIGLLRECAPDMTVNGEYVPLSLRHTSQELRNNNHSTTRPDIVERLVRGMARDGRGERDASGAEPGDSDRGSMRVRKAGRDQILLKLLKSWKDLARTAELRRSAASLLLSHLEQLAPSDSVGKDIPVDTTLGRMLETLTNDLEIGKISKDPSKLLDNALLWLHEQGIVTLGRGLMVFRPAMTIKLAADRRRTFSDADFQPLKQHYSEKALQTHIMNAYAKIGIESVDDGQLLADDYFKIERSEFIRKWFPGQEHELMRETTPDSWNLIVKSLDNPVQEKIVTDDRVKTNVLVLAGPGSGKTRALVHRIAYLIRVRRENPFGILVLVYNRHATTEIRRRLFELIGDDANRVTVSTCHTFAMRIIGTSFANRTEELTSEDFSNLLKEAVALLKGDSLTPAEAEAQRDTLIEGYRWIFVDEYQDIGEDEYELISAIAGRSKEDEDSRLNLFAVGDDDQNIYTFKGASVRYIRKFEKDYNAKASYMVQNYRSTKNIIRAANLNIASSVKRMKVEHDITVNSTRADEPRGGILEGTDPVGLGRVQVFDCPSDPVSQAVMAVNELQRLSHIVTNWDWAKAAVIARCWKLLQPVYSYCKNMNIPVELAMDDTPNLWYMVETQIFAHWLRTRDRTAIQLSEIRGWMEGKPDGTWWNLLREGMETLSSEIGDRETSRHHVLDWMAEWTRDVRKRPSGLLLLTAHSAKGLEFDDVIVLDGCWDRQSKSEDRDANRRLYYVAMTRARRSLAIMAMASTHPIFDGFEDWSVQMREGQPPKRELAKCNDHYFIASLKDIDLGFAGRLSPSSPSLPTIRDAKAGDPVTLHKHGKHWELRNYRGVVVGRMSKSFVQKISSSESTPHLDGLSGKIYAVLVRSHDVSKDRITPKREKWRVIIPEFSSPVPL